MKDIIDNLILISNKSKRPLEVASLIFKLFITAVIIFIVIIYLFGAIISFIYGDELAKSSEVVTQIITIASWIGLGFFLIPLAFEAQKRGDEIMVEDLTDAILDFYRQNGKEDVFPSSSIIDWVSDKYGYKKSGIQPSDFTKNATKQGNRKSILEKIKRGEYKLSKEGKECLLNEKIKK